jgi:hypothetical protein
MGGDAASSSRTPDGEPRPPATREPLPEGVQISLVLVY